MKLTILGSGTVVPNGERNSAGYFVELPDARVMMDCGAGTVQALARFRLPWEQMTHLFISHFHVDHAGELASLFSALRYGLRTDRSEPFMIVGPHGLDRVMDGLKLAFGPRLFDAKFPLSLRMVRPGEQIDLGPESTLSVMNTPRISTLRLMNPLEGRAGVRLRRRGNHRTRRVERRRDGHDSR